MPSLITRLGIPLFLLTGLVTALALPAHRSFEKNATVLILGGGVAGVLAARRLHERGIDDFIIVEARHELGGRLQSAILGAPGNEWTVELGANWVHGTESPDGNINPIWRLANKHGLETVTNDYYNSMTTYDYNGFNDYLDVFNQSIADYVTLNAYAGAMTVDADITSRMGYTLMGVEPVTPQQKASEYYQFDWEYAQTPEETSWIASSWANRFTYDPTQGGFSPENLMSIDQRGFKSILQREADRFLRPGQLLLNATVEAIGYSFDGVEVLLTDGRLLTAQHTVVTFSVGVLQNENVQFEPPLPDWKREAIDSMRMATFTKIFMQFPEHFWFDTQMGLYADEERGRYPVWQNMDVEGFMPGSGILIVTVTGAFSHRIESLSDAQVLSEVLSVLRVMYPNVTIPSEPLAFHFPRWGADPLFRGSYSNWPLEQGGDGRQVGRRRDNVRANVGGGQVWFAGEYTSFKYYGFLHGAYFEGLAAGEELAKCIRGGGCAFARRANHECEYDAGKVDEVGIWGLFDQTESGEGVTMY